MDEDDLKPIPKYIGNYKFSDNTSSISISINDSIGNYLFGASA